MDKCKNETCLTEQGKMRVYFLCNDVLKEFLYSNKPFTLSQEELTTVQECFKAINATINALIAPKQAPEEFTKVSSIPKAEKATKVDFNFGEPDITEQDECDLINNATEDDDDVNLYDETVKLITNYFKRGEKECFLTGKKLNVDISNLESTNREYPNSKIGVRSIIREIKTRILKKCIELLKAGKTVELDDTTLKMVKKYLFATEDNFYLEVDNNKVTLHI